MLSEPDYASYDYDFHDYFSELVPTSIKKTIVTICSKIDQKKRRKLIEFFWKLLLKRKLYFPMFYRAPIECISGFTETMYYGKKFRIPKKFDKYLKSQYENWKVPQKGAKGLHKSLKEIGAGV
jgi:hypothetical protein